MSIVSVPGRFLAISGLSGSNGGVGQALNLVQSQLENAKLQLDDVHSVQLFLRDFSLFSEINKVYQDFFAKRSKFPTRLCVEVDLPTNISFIMNILAIRENDESKKLKIGSRSNWACSVVGPYSQASVVKSDNFGALYLSGIIGLRPFEHLLGMDQKYFINDLLNLILQNFSKEWK